MTWQPEKLTIEEFEARVRAFPWAGSITSFHVHHTAGYHSDWRGAETVRAMRDYHMKTRGYRDSAQHVTLAPDGDVWLGRYWNFAPASAVGHNGRDNAERPFMVEVAGNFQGDNLSAADVLKGKQRESLVRMIAAVQAHFALPADAIMFHREMQATACPGKINKLELIASVTTYRRDSGALDHPLVAPPDSGPVA